MYMVWYDVCIWTIFHQRMDASTIQVHNIRPFVFDDAIAVSDALVVDGEADEVGEHAVVPTGVSGLLDLLAVVVVVRDDDKEVSAMHLQSPAGVGVEVGAVTTAVTLGVVRVGSDGNCGNRFVVVIIDASANADDAAIASLSFSPSLLLPPLVPRICACLLVTFCLAFSLFINRRSDRLGRAATAA
jgi:hypothetical protein